MAQAAVCVSLGLAAWNLLMLGTTAMMYQVAFAALALIYQFLPMTCARIIAFLYFLCFVFDFLHMFLVIIFRWENVGQEPWQPYWISLGVQLVFTCYFLKIVKDGLPASGKSAEDRLLEEKYWTSAVLEKMRRVAHSNSSTDRNE